MATRLKFALVFFMILMTTATNLPDNMIARLGFDADVMLGTLAAVVITGLIHYRRLLFIVLVFFMSLAANMPADFLLNFGLDRDILTIGLVALVLTAPVARSLGMSFMD